MKILLFAIPNRIGPFPVLIADRYRWKIFLKKKIFISFFKGSVHLIEFILETNITNKNTKPRMLNDWAKHFCKVGFIDIFHPYFKINRFPRRFAPIFDFNL